MGEEFKDIPRGQRLEMGPGDVVVVGPNGKLTLGTNTDGSIYVVIDNCQFIAQSKATEKQRAFVDEVWERCWDDLGQKRTSF